MSLSERSRRWLGLLAEARYPLRVPATVAYVLTDRGLATETETDRYRITKEGKAWLRKAE